MTDIPTPRSGSEKKPARAPRPRKTAMPSGALVFMHALGFKGLWKRLDIAANPMRVLRKLVAVERSALESIRDNWHERGTFPRSS
jgi:hypothetical protein